MLQGLSADEMCLSGQKLVPATGPRPGGACCWRHWGLSVTPWGTWGPYPPAKGQEHCGSQSQWLVGTGLPAGRCLSLSSLNQVGVCVCACKLAIKWSSGWDTVKNEAAGCAEMPPLCLFVVQIISALRWPFQFFV